MPTGLGGHLATSFDAELFGGVRPIIGQSSAPAHWRCADAPARPRRSSHHDREAHEGRGDKHVVVEPIGQYRRQRAPERGIAVT